MDTPNVSFLGRQFYRDGKLVVGEAGKMAQTLMKAQNIVEKIAPTGLLTPSQAAEYLAVAEGTLSIWRATNRKVLPYVKVGRSVRYRREDLEKFISANLFNA